MAEVEKMSDADRLILAERALEVEKSLRKDMAGIEFTWKEHFFNSKSAGIKEGDNIRVSNEKMTPEDRVTHGPSILIERVGAQSGPDKVYTAMLGISRQPGVDNRLQRRALACREEVSAIKISNE